MASSDCGRGGMEKGKGTGRSASSSCKLDKDKDKDKERYSQLGWEAEYGRHGEHEKLLEEGEEKYSSNGSGPIRLSSSSSSSSSGAGINSSSCRASWSFSRARKHALLILGLLCVILVGITATKWTHSRYKLAALESKARNLVTALPIKPPFYLSSSNTTAGAIAIQNEALQIAIHASRYSTPICHIKAERLLLYQDLLTASNERIYIAMILYNNQEVLPNFMQELPRLIGLLGRDRVFVSIYENGSDDLTPQFLFLLARELTALGVQYVIIAQGGNEPHTFARTQMHRNNTTTMSQRVSDTESSTSTSTLFDARVPHLAHLRNKVLEPLFTANAQESNKNKPFTTVVFMNDIFHCASDILELLHQHREQKADMACGFDFFSDWVRSPVLGQEFYDTWVARTINGMQLSTPETLGQVASLHPPSRARYLANLPFQVFSCWNGMAVINAQAFQEPHTLHFRSIETSDYASESYLFNVDLWSKGLSRIMVVPSVKVAYKLQDYEVLQKIMGAENQHRQSNKEDAADAEQGEPKAPVTFESVQTDESIQWIPDPPALVDFRPFNFHRPLFEEPTMSPWNATLE